MKTKNTKNAIMYRDVVSKYFPLPQGMDPDDVNIERMIEKSIAKESNLTWVGSENLPWDFKEDRSDAKTASVGITVRKTGKAAGQMVYQGSIQHLQNKVGDLRVVVYNEVTEQCDYFLIPYKNISKMSHWDRKGKQTIGFTYNVREDNYKNDLEQFRRQSFAEICTVTRR